MSLDPSTLEPQRDGNLIQRVWRAITNQVPDMGPQASERDTTESGVLNVDARTQQRTVYQAGARTRQGIYSDADEMDQTSPEFSVALHTIADNVCASEDGEQQSFIAESEDSAVQKVLDDTIAAAHLHEIMPSWTRRTVKYGDGFAEIVVNSELNVVGVKQLPSATMNRNEDEFGNLRLGEPRYDGEAVQNERDECAFEQQDAQGKRLVAAFFPWQIVHTRLFWDGVDPYGVSLAKVGRNVWRKLTSLENSMVIARQTRAYLKLIIYADATGMSLDQRKTMLQNLQQSMTQSTTSEQKRNHQLSVLDNIFMAVNYSKPAGAQNPMPSLTKVDLIDPKNEGLTSLEDVLYMHRQYLSTLRVPPAFLGFEEDINAKATLTGEALQYARLVRSIQGLMGAALTQVFDTALILKGIDPDAVEYDINWPAISSEDEAQMAAANYQQAQADDLYLTMGAIDKEWVQRHRFEMDDDEIDDIEEPAPPEPVVPIGQPPPAPPVAPPARPVAAERMFPHLEALAVGQQRILDHMDGNGNGHNVAAETVRSGDKGVSVIFEKGAIQNDVNPQIRVQPASVRVPDVTVNVPEQAPPSVRVGGTTVNVPEQKPPDVHVHPAVAAPDVTVTVPKPQDIEIERNRDGSIKGIRQKPK